MKDLGTAKKILGMSTIKNRSKEKWKLSQFSILRKAVSKFCMENAKVAIVPLGCHFKLIVSSVLLLI